MKVAVVLILVSTIAGCIESGEGPAPDSGHGATLPLNEADGEIESPEWVRDPNAEQTGTRTDCLDHNLLWDIDDVSSPGDHRVEVEPQTYYSLNVTRDEFGVLHPRISIIFFEANGHPRFGPFFEEWGRVPSESAYGIICVSALGSQPDIPYIFAAWAYRDGYTQMN